LSGASSVLAAKGANLRLEQKDQMIINVVWGVPYRAEMPVLVSSSSTGSIRVGRSLYWCAVSGWVYG
jgi:hypothetical protein